MACSPVKLFGEALSDEMVIIALIGGKAYLAREHYCDGLGDCLPGCPTGAITFETREAPAYDEAAVLKAKAEKAAARLSCPGTRARTLSPESDAPHVSRPSQLRQWPVQLKLVPTQAPWFENADVLVAADCTAYAYGDFHKDFLRGKVLLIACPKLDSVDYSEKLTAIFRGNSIRSVTVLRMEVPAAAASSGRWKPQRRPAGDTFPEPPKSSRLTERFSNKGFPWGSWQGTALTDEGRHKAACGNA